MPVNKTTLDATIAAFNVDRTKTFAEFIAELLANKYVEIYLGDSYEEVKTEQISTSYAAVFCGKVVAAYRECLVLNSFYSSGNEMKLGNLVFLNERAIRGLREIDGNGTVNDLFIRSGSESLKIKQQFVDHE